MNTKKLLPVLISTILSLVIFSCSSSPPVQRFLLSPASYESSDRLFDDEDKIVLSIGYIKFPEYLERPEIVSYKTKNELKFEDFNRWAEPLSKNFERILIENLSQLLNTNQVYTVPAFQDDSEVVQVNIKVNEFGLNQDSLIVLNARWNVSRGERKDYKMTEHSGFSAGAHNKNLSQIVGLMSELVGDLSVAISKAIIELKK